MGQSLRMQALELPLLCNPLELYAAKTPLALAIVEDQRKINYSQLAKATNELAASLASAGIGLGDHVGILMENRIEAYIGILACLRVGACYVPLHPKWPRERRLRILRDAEVKLLLVSEKETNFETDSVIYLTYEANNLNIQSYFYFKNAQESLASTSLIIDNENIPAYLMYTSGSTGLPKGVFISHRNIKNFLRWGLDFFAPQSTDSICGQTHISFDLSVFDFFSAIYSGACLYPIIAAGDLAFPGNFLRRNKISIWLSVPSVLTNMVRARQLTPNAFPDLRYALFAGEALSPNLARNWLETHPHIPLVNLYGPTEAFVCTYHVVTKEDLNSPSPSLPIGKALPGLNVFLREEISGALLTEANKPGAIYVSGKQVSSGYWKRPELNQHSFSLINNEPTYNTGDIGYWDLAGNLYWSGRKDNQVKILGHRIELEEVEHVVRAFPNIMECLVLPSEKSPHHLIAYISIEADFTTDFESRLISHCQALLPPVMVPVKIVKMQNFPKTENGKIDRLNFHKKNREYIAKQ